MKHLTFCLLLLLVAAVQCIPHTLGTIDVGYVPWLPPSFRRDEWRYNSFRDTHGQPHGAGFWYSRAAFITTVNEGFRMYLHYENIRAIPKNQRTRSEQAFFEYDHYAKPVRADRPQDVQKLAKDWNVHLDPQTIAKLASKEMCLLHIPYRMTASSLTAVQDLVTDGIAHADRPELLRDAFGKMDPATNTWKPYGESSHRVLVLVSTPPYPQDPTRRHNGPDCRIHSVSYTKPLYVIDHDLPSHELPERQHLPGFVSPRNPREQRGMNLAGSNVIAPHRQERHPEPPIPPPHEPHDEPGGPHHPLPGDPRHPLPGGPHHPLPGGPHHPLPGGPHHPLPHPAPPHRGPHRIGAADHLTNLLDEHGARCQKSFERLWRLRVEAEDERRLEASRLAEDQQEKLRLAESRLAAMQVQLSVMERRMASMETRVASNHDAEETRWTRINQRVDQLTENFTDALRSTRHNLLNRISDRMQLIKTRIRATETDTYESYWWNRLFKKHIEELYKRAIGKSILISFFPFLRLVSLTRKMCRSGEDFHGRVSVA